VANTNDQKILKAIQQYGFTSSETPYELVEKLGKAKAKLTSVDENGKPLKYGRMVVISLESGDHRMPAHRRTKFEESFESGGDVLVGIFRAKEDYTTSSGTVIPKGKMSVRAYVPKCLL
jgi:hypothetical protein